MTDITNTAAISLVSSATATGAGSAYKMRRGVSTFQADGTTTAGAGTASIKVQGSNNNSDWIDIATITLTLATTSSSDGFVSSAPWVWVRGNVTAISGTGASVSLVMGV